MSVLHDPIKDSMPSILSGMSHFLLLLRSSRSWLFDIGPGSTGNRYQFIQCGPKTLKLADDSVLPGRKKTSAGP